MRVVHRAQEGVTLIITAVAHHRAFGEQLAVKLVPILKPGWSHAARRPDAVRRLVGKRNVERAVFTTEKACRRERLQLLRLTIVKTLPDVDERRNRRIQRPQGSRDERAEVWRRHR